MGDIDFQNFSTVQSKEQLSPVTIPSASTIRPITFLTFVTGTVRLETVIPPLTGTHMLILIFTDPLPGQFLTSGNLFFAIQPDQNIPSVLIYNPINGKYYPGTWSD